MKLTKIVMISAVCGALVSCSFGSDNRAPISVSSITGADMYFASNGTIVVNGNGLDQGVTVSAGGCTTLTEQKTLSTPSQHTYSCALVTSTSKLSSFTQDMVVTAKRADGVILKTQSLTIHQLPNTVSDITSDLPIIWGAQTRFTVVGNNLTAATGIHLSSTNCAGIVAVDAGTDTSRSYTCSPAYDSSKPISQLINITANSAAGDILLTKTFAALAPQITAYSVTMPLNRYGSIAKISVTGTNLDSSLDITPTCTALTLLSGSTATQQNYTCIVSAVAGASALVFNLTRAGDSTALQTKSMPLPPTPTVAMNTSMGTMNITLNPTAAPLSVNNFLRYVNDSFYSNLIFHRVIANPTASSISIGIIQGGGFTTGPALKTPTYPAITLESNNGLKNVRGTIAMARTKDANSATSQFYFNVTANTAFDYTTSNPGYAVFGSISATDSSSLAVMDAINAVGTATKSGMSDVPVNDVVINSVTQTQ